MKRFMLALIALACAVALTAPVGAKTVTLKEGVYAKMETSKGPMIIELYEDLAPKTVENFIQLAEGKKKWKDPETGEWQEGEPLYDGTTFHRIIKGFMCQGGDPSGTGSGNVGFTIPMEKAPQLRHDRRGRVAMARRPNPDSASCQFYITFKAVGLDNPPNHYAVFGQVIHGMETLARLEATPVKRGSRGESSQPVNPPTITKVEIIRVDKGQTKDVELKGLSQRASSAGIPSGGQTSDADEQKKRQEMLMKAGGVLLHGSEGAPGTETTY